LSHGEVAVRAEIGRGCHGQGQESCTVLESGSGERHIGNEQGTDFAGFKEVGLYLTG
jgi:hypothetical protein